MISMAVNSPSSSKSLPMLRSITAAMLKQAFVQLLNAGRSYSESEVRSTLALSRARKRDPAHAVCRLQVCSALRQGAFEGARASRHSTERWTRTSCPAIWPSL
jgi:hypothetical protein